MDLQIGEEPVLRKRSGKGHQGGDGGGGKPPSKIVMLMVELFRDTVQAVEQKGIENVGEFFIVLDTLHTLGASPFDICSEFTEGVGMGEILCWLERKNPPPETLAMQAYEAAVVVLVRKGLLVAGRRYDPFSGKRLEEE